MVVTGPRTAAARTRAIARDKEPLQVRIPVEVKRSFKAYAALHGLEPNELFVEVWEHYERTSARAPTQGRDPEP